MDRDTAKKIALLGVWNLDDAYKTVTLIAEQVAVEKVTVTKLKSGEEKEIVKEDHPRLPVRYYNLQYHLEEHDDDLDAAISAFQFAPNIYLPREKGYSSYKSLLEDAKERRLDRVEILNT